jgi:anti-anti-sigma factor
MGESFSVDINQQKDVYILNLQGLLNADAEDALNLAYKEIAEQNGSKIILNFENVKQVNSTGIAILLGIVSDSREYNQSLTMTNLTPHFYRIFDLVGLTQYVKAFDDLEKAVEYFQEIE